MFGSPTTSAFTSIMSFIDASISFFIPCNCCLSSGSEKYVDLYKSSIFACKAPAIFLIVEKFASLKEYDTITDISNIGFLGTNIVSGSAIAIVIGTGSSTYFGSMAKSLYSVNEKNSFETIYRRFHLL